MSGAEIAECTPWEIEKRLDGYARRMKYKRMFTASFVTAPIINGGMRAPKKIITAQKLLPDDFKEEISEEKRQEIAALVKTESARRRKNGGGR